MKFSNKQKQAVEKITGKPWDSFPPEALESYFTFTDRGKRTELFNRVWRLQLPDNKFNKVEQSLWDLMQSHTFHPVIVEGWREDFKKGLLSLSDFSGYPKAYVEHATEIYHGV